MIVRVNSNPDPALSGLASLGLKEREVPSQAGPTGGHHHRAGVHPDGLDLGNIPDAASLQVLGDTGSLTLSGLDCACTTLAKDDPQQSYAIAEFPSACAPPKNREFVGGQMDRQISTVPVRLRSELFDKKIDKTPHLRRNILTVNVHGIGPA